MLKSTYKPSPGLAPLPPGWTEHKAPTGHTYYYNAETKVSTYKRPGVEAAPAPEPAVQNPYANLPSLADPRAANAYIAQFNQPPPSSHRGGHGAGRGGFEGRPRPQPTDKPRRKEPIPGCEPWILVYTKYSRRFVYNPIKNTSYWRIPEKLMPGILELDKARIRGKAVGEDTAKEAEDAENPTSEQPAGDAAGDAAEDSSEYEEVEVTDDEDEDDHPSKRQRTEEPEGPVVFTEDDIAMQLQAMGEEYGLDPGEYDDGHMEDWPEGAEGLEFSKEDAKFLFKDLLNDFNISPYSPWDQLIEEGKIIEDPRYTALTTMKARKECWDEWSRERITELKEQRAREEKKDPRIAYMAFLQEKATPKLYWPEFKRKYKKEAPMKDFKLTEKDREKAYRDYINRLKLPQSTLKADLTALLKSQPPHILHNRSVADGLPAQVLGDLRYASVEPKERDALIEAYVQTLPPPPDKDGEAAHEEEERRKKREKALEQRNKMVEEQRRKREREVAASKARLREGERELEAAMHVGKRGLQGQLADMKMHDKPEEE